MPYVDMIFGINSGGSQIAALRLDVLVREDLDFPSVATEYPVEDGSPISDAILPGAPKLSINGSVSASSATILGGLLTGGVPPGKAKLLSAIDALRTVYVQHTPITVVTGLGVYPELAMSGCKLTRSNGQNGGSWLDIQADFVAIRKVVLKTTEVPADKVADGAKGKAGATKAAAGKDGAAKEPTAPVEAKSSSILSSLKTSVFGK